MSEPPSTSCHEPATLKRLAADAALAYVRDGMIVGLGTGSTAMYVVIGLARRVREGLTVRGVPTSRATAELARQQGVPLIETEEDWIIDVAIDGADQVDPQLNVIKGGGGALLKEKIVAAAAREFIVVIDHTKRVPMLGAGFPLPVEVVRFGWGSTARLIEALGTTPILRERNGEPFTTESGHYILDVGVDSIAHPLEFERELQVIPGVVETGLFIGRTDRLIVGTPGGVETHSAVRA